MFVNMEVYSSYSLLQSTIRLHDYVTKAKERGYTSVALTDNGVLHGAVEFYQICQKQQMRAIIGVTFEVQGLLDKQQTFPVIVYAKDTVGYQQLMCLSSDYQMDAHFDLWKKLQENTQHLKLLLPFERSEWLPLLEQEDSVSFDVYINLLPKMEIAFAGDLQKAAMLQEIANHFPVTVVAHHTCYYVNPDDHFSWKVVQAIRENTTIDSSQLGVTGNFYLPEKELVEEMYRNHHHTWLLENLAHFIQDLHVHIPLHQSLLPKFTIPTNQSTHEYLAEQCQHGLLKKGLQQNIVYQDRLHYELEIIHQMEFDDYFLIIWDIMEFAARSAIQTGPGRGSAAGSLVAYALGITKVDPIRYDLLFERFLNPERFTMPDIDLDIPDVERDRILSYVEERYGKTHVAQIATFGTLAAKQALRDVGRVLKVTPVDAKNWSQAVPNELGIKLVEAYQKSRALQTLVERSEKNQLIYDTARRIEGLPRHLSTHAAGVVISDKPLTTHIPVMQREGVMLTTQYTMKYVELVGLLKMDFLGLKNLTLLHDSLQLACKLTQKEMDIDTIPLDDQATLQLFQKADTSGIFQFESQGIRNVLKRVVPNSLEDLAAVNALYRPGPMEQINTFVKRKKGQEKISYPHPDLATILQNTYGVMVYQEQVMQVTSKMAGFSLGQADVLRRAISKKDRAEIERQQQAFVMGAVQKGYTTEVAKQVYHYIEQFANYGFNRSHSFAYSLLAYQLAYLKVHYPIAFFTALLNMSAAGSNKIQEYLLALKQLNIKVLSPSIQTSVEGYSISPEGVQIGLSAIKGLKRDVIQFLLQERHQHGLFRDFTDFCYRLGQKYCKEEWLEVLVHSGALDCFGETRATLLHAIPALVSSVKLNGNNISLEFDDEMALRIDTLEELPLITLLEHEEEVLGFTVSKHPTEEFDVLYQQHRLQLVQTLRAKATVEVIGLLKNIRKIKTKKGDPMAFATLQDASGMIPVTIFPEVYPSVAALLEEQAFVWIKGKVDTDRLGEWQVQVSQLFPIEHLRRQTHQCFIRLKAAQQTQQVMQEIERILYQHKGDIPVSIYLEDKKQLVQRLFAADFDGSDEGVLQLETLLGTGSVKIK